ncbi:MAG: hypothetical protein H6Q32_365 [Bacteroidetes bacterium]|nr:hypothetical protein [Bacteroidota bacterium]
MSTTLIVAIAVIVLYLGGCVRQWRRLDRIDKEKDAGTYHQGVRR